MFYKIEDSFVTIKVKAQPKASKSEFCEPYGDDAIKVRIKAPAVEGAANEELFKFLAKTFKVTKSSIILKSGDTSKIKVIIFPLSEKFKEWIAKNGY